MNLTPISIHSNRILQLHDTQVNEDVNSAIVLSGRIESRFSNINSLIDFQPERHSFQYNPGFQAGHTIQSGQFEAFQLTYDLPFFKSLAHSAESVTLDKVAEKL